LKKEGAIEKFYQYSFPMQTVLVTCNDEKGKTNVITIAWHTPISKDPPLYGLSVGPSRYSHDLIAKNKEFVINFVPYDLVEKAHYCGTKSGRTLDKLKNASLKTEPSQKIKVPLLKDCYAHLECTLVHQFSLGDHTFFVGKVLAVSSNTEAFENNLLKTESINPLYYIGANSYTTLNGKIKKRF